VGEQCSADVGKNEVMEVVIIGGGIGGLTLALSLERLGIPSRVFEAVSRIEPLGVGINLLPHAMQVLGELGLVERLSAKGIETRELCFYTRHGQLVDREPRGRHAGYAWPQISIHRAELHEILLSAVRERLGAEAVTPGQRCVSFRQNTRCVHIDFVDSARAGPYAIEADVAIGCDGIHSAVRKHMHPTEAPLIDHESTSYRGTTSWKPFLTGASMAYVGTYNTGKLVIYPMRDKIDGEGRQLLNWVLELRKANDRIRDWNRRVNIEECIQPFEDWHFEWLDVPAMLGASNEVLQYPQIDQNPLPFWSVNRVTLLGDAAHPMLPRGSNGAAQAILDARLLARLLFETKDIPRALKQYEAERLPATADVVLNNRNRSPDAILRVIEERTGGQPFARLADVISRKEMDEWHTHYKNVAGFARDNLRSGAA
jgi:5-methylphenazine-1-carboxylate 1-monooxygenase